MKDLEELIVYTSSNDIDKILENKDIMYSNLKSLYFNKTNQDGFFNKILKIKKMIKNQKTQESFIRSYFRIFKNNIDKDGRGSSIVIEITKKCNKRCLHCYSKNPDNSVEMSDDLLDKIINYSRKNLKHIFITGGEPSLDPRVLSIAEKNPDLIFFMFTNSSTMTDSYAKKLKYIGNVIPMLSIDGSTKAGHDFLRGDGSFSEVSNAMDVLFRNKAAWGFITLVTEKNADDVLSKSFILDKKQKGAFIARFLEYLPVGPNPIKELILSGDNYFLLEKRKLEIIKNNEIYMQQINQNKCRGLLFINVYGDIKNCFCFHYSKYNANNGSLGKNIQKTCNDWISYSWDGECPIYSDPVGFKNHLENIGWKKLISYNEPYLSDLGISDILRSSYKKFLVLNLKQKHVI